MTQQPVIEKGHTLVIRGLGDVPDQRLLVTDSKKDKKSGTVTLSVTTLD